MNPFENFLASLSDDQRTALADLIITGNNPANRSRNRTSTTRRGGQMAKLTAKQRLAQKRAAKSSGTTRTKATSGRKSTAKATTTKSTGPKRTAAAASNEALTKKMLAMRKQGKSWAEVGAELSITPGKAQFLNMLHEVAEGNVPTISTSGNEDAVVKRIAAARAKADEYSSWGWLAARTGWSEGKIKTLLEASGDYTPRAENIAAVRAGTNGTTKKPAKKRASSKASTAKARAKARTAKKRPSKKG